MTRTVPISATRPTSLRPRSSSIRCSARSLGSASSASASAWSSASVAPRGARAGDGADGHLAVAHAHQDLRAGADEGEAAEVEMEQERRGVGAAQRAVERERRQRERRREALREHHLEDVAGDDVLLGALHHRHVFGGRRVGRRLGRGELARGDRRRVRQRLVERRDDALQALARRLVGLLAPAPWRRAAPA